MAAQELLDYFKTCKTQGVPEADIKKTLIGAGWDETTIAQAWTEFARPIPTVPEIKPRFEKEELMRLPREVSPTPTKPREINYSAPAQAQPHQEDGAEELAPMRLIDTKDNTRPIEQKPAAAATFAAPKDTVPHLDTGVVSPRTIRPVVSVEPTPEVKPLAVSAQLPNLAPVVAIPAFHPAPMRVATPSSQRAQPVLHSSSRAITKVIAVIVGVIIAGSVTAVGIFIYKKGSGSFSTSTTDQLVLAFQKLQKKPSALYNITLSVKAQPRDKAATAFLVDSPEQEKQRLMRERDSRRLDDLKRIRTKLDQGYDLSTFHVYDKNIDTYRGIGLPLRDPLGNAYAYTRTQGGANYKLQATFETNDAIAAIKTYPTKNPPAIDGKTVIFTKDKDGGNYNITLAPQATSFGLGTPLRILENAANSLPPDIDGQMQISVNVQNDGGLAIDARMQATEPIHYDGGAITTDVEFLKKGDAAYARINSFPVSLADSGALKAQWAQISRDNSSDLFEATGINALNSIIGPAQTDLYQSFFAEAYKEGVLVAHKPARENAEGTDALHYQIKLAHPEKVPALYQLIAKEWSAHRPALASSDNTLFASDSKLPDYLAKHLVIDAWVNSKTNDLIRIALQLTIVPHDDAKRLKDVQIVFSLKASIAAGSDITEPKDALAPDAAIELITGTSHESHLFSEQEEAVRHVRIALELFRGIFGKYPSALEELRTQGPNGSTAVLATIPNDVFTGKPLSYQSTGTDYSLGYTMQFPPGVAPGGSFYKAGDNTATSQTVSR